MRCDLHDGCTLTVELEERTGQHVVEMPVPPFLAEWFGPLSAEYYLAEINHNADMRGEGSPADANNARARRADEQTQEEVIREIAKTNPNAAPAARARAQTRLPRRRLRKSPPAGGGQVTGWWEQALT